MVVFIAVLIASVSNYFKAESFPPIEKTLRFTYTLKNISNELVENADFVAMIPAEIKGSQHIVSISTTEKYSLENKDLLSQSMKFQIKNIPPFSSKVISITIVLGMSEKPKNEIHNKNEYLKAEKYIEKDSLTVKNVSALLDKTTKNSYAKSTFEWLINNVKDAGYVSDNKGAQYAIEKLLGDCTEYMYAFVALERANDTPARAIAGFFMPQPAGILNASDYHNWAEFYDAGKWKLADPQKRIFDQQYQNYIVVRFLSGESSANRFLITDNRLTVSL